MALGNTIEFSLRARDEFSKGFSGLRGQITLVAAAATAAGAAVFALANRFAKSEDAALKTSQRLGLTTEELSKLHFQARLSGVATATLDMALQRMTRRVGEAAVGTGEAKDAIRELGLDAEKLGRMTPDEQLRTFAEALHGVESNSDKVRLAFKLFDSEGVALLQTMTQGAAGFKKAGEEAERLGIVIGTDDAEAASRFNDALLGLNSALGGLSKETADEVIPALTELFKVMEDGVFLYREHRDEILSWLDAWLKWFPPTAAAYRLMRAGIDTLRENAQATREADMAYSDFGGTLGAVAAKQAQVTLVSKAALEAQQKMADGLLAHEVRVAEERVQSWVDAERARIAATAQTNAELAAEASSFAHLAALIEQQANDSRLARLEQYQNEVLAKQGEFAGFVEAMEAAAAQRNLEQQDLMRQIAFENMVTDFDRRLVLENEQFQRRMETAAGNHSLEQAVIEDHNRAILEIEKAALDARLAQSQTALRGFAALARVSGAKTFKLYKALAYGQTIIATYLAATKALASAPPPLSYVLAAAAVAQGLANAAMISKQKPPAAHGGLTSVPAEQTFLLQQGERVLSPLQNRDLTAFLRGQGGGGGSSITVENLNVHILENATNFDTLMRMDDRDMREIVAGPIIKALDNLDRSGVRPNFAQRGRGGV